MRETQVRIGISGLEIFSVSLEDCHGAGNRRSDDFARECRERSPKANQSAKNLRKRKPIVKESVPIRVVPKRFLRRPLTVSSSGDQLTFIVKIDC